ncbi:MAG: NYN domain-containing protein [Acidimicrobiales bacterium]
MARAGQAADPPLDPPRLLRPFLRFARLPDHALLAVRRALENDVGFRSRVAEAAGDDELDRAAWLFLHRPPGWAEELAERAGEVQAVADVARETREERTAVRRLAQMEQAVERAERAATKARAEAAGAAAEVAEERRARRAAELAADALTRRVVGLEEDVAAGRRRAADAKLELSRWRARVDQLEGDLARAAARPQFDPTGVYAALTVSADALRAVRAAVAEAEARMWTGAVTVVEGPGRAGKAVGPPTTRHRPPAPRRRPAPLPPAIFDDSAEAAAHLVRVSDVLVVVDGYNAAMSIWPGVAPPELRQRLLDALCELVARTGADVHVVFDGVESVGPARPAARLGVRVTFSPPDVEADDVILAMVDELPPTRPVVVASSDRRVQEGARTRGANVVSSAQLGSVLGR